MVTFTTNGAGQPLDILRLDPFIVGVVGANGQLMVVLRNATDFTFQDFHFETQNFQGANWMGNGLPFFGDFTSTGSRIDFVVGGTGIGIAPGTTFTVTFTGFLPNSTIRGTATIPEPASLLLLGTGVVGVAIKVRKKLESGKGG